MNTPSHLTDRAALLRNRTRAKRLGAELFLHEDAAAEIEERLNEVKKVFTTPVVITGFAKPWQDLLPGAQVIEDAEVLDLEPGAYDLVIHAMSLHWANDPVGQLIQCRRALQPDGLFLAVLFGGQTLSELRTALAETESRLTGGLSPRVLPMAEIRDLGGLLQRAGFALPVADAAKKTATYRTAFHLMAELRAMGETNALADRNRSFPTRALFAETAEFYASHFAGPDGRIRATFDMIYLTGWAPDEHQSKPLRPGTATNRLADALGVPETRLNTSADPSGKGGK